MGLILRREGSIRTKHLDTLSHTTRGLLRAVREHPDVIGLHNYPNGRRVRTQPWTVMGRSCGARPVRISAQVNVDEFDSDMRLR